MDVFAGLADPVRRAILRRLVAGPARVVDLAAEHSVSRPAISRHLRLLGEAGLVHADDVGRERHYRLLAAALVPVRELLAELSRPPVPESALDALDTEVRRTARENTVRQSTARGKRPGDRPTEFEETA